MATAVALARGRGLQHWLCNKWEQIANVELCVRNNPKQLLGLGNIFLKKIYRLESSQLEKKIEVHH